MSVFVTYTILFLIVLFLNGFIIEISRKEFEKEWTFSGFNGLVLAFNTFAFTNNAIVYMLILYIIYNRLTLINEYLKKLQKSECQSRDITKSFKDVATFVDRVCDCLGSLKVCFTIKIVTYLIHFAFFVILGTYGIISYFLQQNSTRLDLAHSLITLTWEIYYAPVVIWIYIFTNAIKRQGKEIEINIQKLLYKNRQNIKVYKNSSFVSMQLHHRRPIIECGVFVLDWNLLLYSITACFSYLVIIIQFELNGSM